MDNSAANKLKAFAESLNIPFGFERSVKLQDRELFCNRFLITFPLTSLGSHPVQPLTELGASLGMPKVLQQHISNYLMRANIIHLGYEGNCESPHRQQTTQQTCKLYFEYANGIGETSTSTKSPAHPILVHRALKWDADNPNRQAITDYHWQPGYTIKQLQEALLRVYGKPMAQASYRIVDNFIRLVLQRINSDELQLLEVTEQGNPRLSFDLNVYDAQMRLGDIPEQLNEMKQNFKIDDALWQQQILANADKALGHLSGGLDRHGREFLTLYFGVEEMQGAINPCNL